MPDKRLDGIKAAATKVAQYGPGELHRAGDQAAWTKRYSRAPRSENPFLRTKIYTPSELDRVKQFLNWKDQNPDKDDPENPHRWKLS
jgi:hypothetical protein